MQRLSLRTSTRRPSSTARTPRVVGPSSPAAAGQPPAAAMTAIAAAHRPSRIFIVIPSSRRSAPASQAEPPVAHADAVVAELAGKTPAAREQPPASVRDAAALAVGVTLDRPRTDRADVGPHGEAVGGVER